MEDVFSSFSISLSALDIVDLFFLRILAAGIGPVKDPPFFMTVTMVLCGYGLVIIQKEE